MKRRVCAIVEASGEAGRNPLLRPLTVELASRGVELICWDPTGAIELPPTPPSADLYLLKADDPAALSAAGCLHDTGAPFLNSYPSTEAAADKARTLARLAVHDVPVPSTRLVADPTTLAEALAAGPRFVKPVRGAHGVGAAKLEPGQGCRAGPGPWLVQEVVADTPWVMKAYGVADRVALRWMPFSAGAVDSPRLPMVDADRRLVDLARRAARVTGLVCYGADFVLGRNGPVMVDLNSFPGYRTVEEAPRWVAAAALDALESSRWG